MNQVAAFNMNSQTFALGDITEINLPSSVQDALHTPAHVWDTHALTFGALGKLRDLLTGLHSPYEIMILSQSGYISSHPHTSLLSALKHFTTCFLHLNKDTVTLLARAPHNFNTVWLSRSYIHTSRLDLTTAQVFTPDAPQVYLGISAQRLRIESCQQLAELSTSAHTLYLTTSNLTLTVKLGDSHAN